MLLPDFFNRLRPHHLTAALINPMRRREQPAWWVQLSSEYLRSLIRRGRRPRTPKAYSTPLQNFGYWLHDAGVETMGELNRQHLEQWQDDIRESLSPGTQRLARVVIRGALRWAADEELALSKPTLWLRVMPLRIPNRKPRPIPFRDLALIWIRLDEWCEASPTLSQLRTRALFWAILSSGARISEALALRRDSILDDSAVIEQKGGSDHVLVFSATALAAIADYARARTDREPMLFPITYKEAQKGWNRLCAELSIPRFTSHRIRHSCVTELLRRHVDSLIIAKHVGHRGLSSIAGYAEVALDTRREAMLLLDDRSRGLPPISA